MSSFFCLKNKIDLCFVGQRWESTVYQKQGQCIVIEKASTLVG